MELKLTRRIRTENSTISNLLIDEKQECYVLEDKDRGLKQDMLLEEIKAKKIDTKTAIPTGRYEIIVNFSNRFKKPLPLLLNVPGFDGIRIHPGNTEVDTHGCLLPGTTTGVDFVGNSRVAFNDLFEKIKQAVEMQKVFIEIA